MNKILQWNCRGLQNKWSEIQYMMSNLRPTILCLSETHLIPSDNVYYKLKTYQSHHQYASTTRRKGGTSIFVSTSIPHSPVQITTPHQATAIQATIHNVTLTICSVYIPPTVQTDYHFFHSLIQQLPNPFILCGDFNAKHQLWGSPIADRRGRTLEDIIINHNLHVLNDGSPTHLHEYNGTLSHIDITICSPTLVPLLNWKCHDSLHSSDHFPISIPILSSSEPYDRKIRWNMKQANWNTFNNSLSSCSLTTDYTKIIPQITHQILSAAKTSIPSQQTNQKPHKSCPWWNTSCKTAIKKRQQALRFFRSHRTHTALHEYKKAKAEARRTIRAAKRSSWASLISSFTHRTPTTKLWNIIRSFRQVNNLPPTLPTTHIGGTLITDQPTVLNLLGLHYSSISKTPLNPQNTTNSTSHIILNNSTNHSSHTYNHPFTIEEYNKILLQCSSKSSGPDQLLYPFFKNMTHSNKKKILHCLNTIWNHDFFPPQWQHSYIIPILKPGKPPSELSSYRPIQLTSCFCKLFERLIQPRLLLFTEKHSLISPQQTAYTKNRSTMDNINYLTSHIRLAYAKNKSTLAVYLDLSSAFNTVSKTAIIKILTKSGLRGHLLHFLSGYLSNRSFQVKTSHTSITFTQDSGVVQGGVLSPTLFSIAVDQLIRNIPKVVKYSLYADDLVIWTSGSDLNTQVSQIQTALDSITNRCSFLGLKISPTKTAATLFRKNSSKQPTQPLINVGGSPIHFQNTTKYLGIHLDSRLSFKTHIQNSKIRALQRISILKCLSHPLYGTDRIVLTRIYKTLIRPILEYCSPTYVFLPKSVLSTYDTIQNTCLRIASGALRTSPITKLLLENNTWSLHDRRIHKTIQSGMKIHADTTHLCHQLLFSHSHMNNTSPYNVNRLCGYTIGLAYHTACKAIDFSPPLLSPPVKTLLTTQHTPHITEIDSLTIPQQIQQSFLEHRAKHAHHTFIYTDGSARDDCTGCAVVIPSSKLEFPHRLPPRTSVFNAEQYAILLAIKIVKHHEIATTTIVTDCLSALKSLLHPKNNLSSLTLQILSELPKHYDIKFLWVPSHVGIPGNEHADKVAKHALTLSVISTPPLSPVDIFPEVTRKLKAHQHIQHNMQHCNTNQRKHYTTHRNTDVLCRRRLSIALLRLRIGHTFITHKHIFERTQPALCPRCQTRITIEHILLHCPIYRVQRAITYGSLTTNINLDNLLYNPHYQPHLLKFLTITSLYKKL